MNKEQMLRIERRFAWIPKVAVILAPALLVAALLF